MKHIYCLLLVIIFLYFICDNKLIEANDHEYDTSEDSVANYRSYDIREEDSIFDQLGLTGLLDDEDMEYDTPEGPLSGLDCTPYENVYCNEGISAHMSGDDWDYGNKNTERQNKINCMNCFKCKDKYALTDEFYSHMCDSIAGCYDNPIDYITDSLPYTYAYKNTNFENECGSTDLNAIQEITCQVLEGNSVLDALTMTTIPDTARCSAEIATLELGGPIGDFASAIL